MRRSRAVLATLAVAAQWGPVLTSIPSLRRTVTPTLSGISHLPHVALTYDDGPDPGTTPHFLQLLEKHGRTATFFLLGAYVAQNRDLVHDMVARGHELAVHGWDHQCLAVKRPGVLVDELRRTKHHIEDITGGPVRWYRPPYGVLTGEGLVAARAAKLHTVLWTTWGRDWTSTATAESVAHTVNRRLRPGGTVLLHDTDRTAAPGSWRRTLAASHLLLESWSEEGLGVGTLRDHW